MLRSVATICPLYCLLFEYGAGMATAVNVNLNDNSSVLHRSADIIDTSFDTTDTSSDTTDSLNPGNYWQGKTDITSIVATRLMSGTKAGQHLAALVDFLVNGSTGRQLYLLHDHSLTDMSPAVEACYRRWGDVIIFKFTWELTEVEAALRSNYHFQELRNILVICSDVHTTHIFQQIRERSLESATLYWYIVLFDDITEQILDSIREGTQFSLAVRKDHRYQLFTSFVDSDNNIALDHRGWWSWNADQGKPIKYLKKPLYLNLGDVYRNFGGRVLRVAVVDNWPYFKVTRSEDGSLQPHSGVDYNVLNALAKKLNFTYELVDTLDGQWGGVMDNGTVTGMIGLVARHEAHLAINEITISGTREKVVDFTAPYFLESTTVISQAPAMKNRAFAVFSPFTVRIWLMVVAMTMLMGPILSVVGLVRARYLQEGVRYSLLTYAFNVFRSLVVQNNLISSQHWEQRIIFFAWYFFCFTIYEEHVNLLDGNHFIIRDVRIFNILLEYHPLNIQEAEDGIYKEVWDVFDPSEGYVNTYTDGTNKVLTGKFVFINARLGAEIRAIAKGRHRFYLGKSSFYPQGYGIACTSGSPFKNVIEQILTHLGSAGLVQKWIRDEMEKESNHDDGANKGPGAISFVHLQAAFFLLGMGSFVGGLTLLMERFVYSRQATFVTVYGHTKAATNSKVAEMTRIHGDNLGEDPPGPQVYREIDKDERPYTSSMDFMRVQVSPEPERKSSAGDTTDSEHK
ncbi:Glutamate receptor ionotropic, delta-1-like 22 [Homarus americanus]|uniref:Glutamate receptor ionotropic, delta-1-like 22 n=1 Tax=Homarus americanus TaxID=6706 RepID=A0A8J5K3K6_HOMAM|nr:Glutamate receptor ionotropic, delta-1-like 22 [Homarus americanus]